MELTSQARVNSFKDDFTEVETDFLEQSGEQYPERTKKQRQLMTKAPRKGWASMTRTSKS